MTETSIPSDFAGLKVLIFGLGRFGGGIGAADFFGRRGAEVTVTDLRSREQLAESRERLADVPIARWHLGGHCDEDFESAEWIVVNPAIPPHNPHLERARRAGARLVTEMGLFLRWCPARAIAGITGSNGKSTTTTLVGAMLEASGHRVHVGGNIGRSLLPEIDRIAPEDRVVLELSSFQLARFGHRTPRPTAVAITELSDNHLDWHGGQGAYREAKETILDGAAQEPGHAVLPAESAHFESWSTRARRQGREVTPFSSANLPGGGVGYVDDTLAIEGNGQVTPILPVTDLPLRGSAQRGNIACATALARALGGSVDGIRAALQEFRPLPHRQELVATHDGIRFVNDSKATTTPAACCALEAEAPGVILLAGGRGKGASFDALGASIRQHARVAILYGEAAEEIAAAVETAPGPETVTVHRAPRMGEAFERAVVEAREGETVLLSPACASFDEFRDYEARGETFARLARAWSAPVPG